jgi:hypothetical protein
MTDPIKWLAFIAGACMIVTGLNGLRTGWLYHRGSAFSPLRTVCRDDEPFLYWMNLVMRMVAGGALVLTGLIFILRG